MAACFEVGWSRHVPSERGLFASRSVRAADWVATSLDHSPPVASADERVGWDTLDFFVPHDVDPTTVCVSDGVVRRLAEVSVVDEAHVPRYVCVKRDCWAMRANDLAYTTGCTREEYVRRMSDKNLLELVLVLKAGRVVGVAAHLRGDVCAGDEVGVAYGEAYWFEAHSSIVS